MNSDDYVLLQCYEETRSRLRIKVETPGYIRGANCQFPKQIRKAGRKYLVPKNSLQLVATRGTYFYSLNRSYYSQIQIIDDTNEFDVMNLQRIAADITRVYENEQETECIICMTNDKNVVFDPCCHFYVCHDCGEKITLCPICRETITHLIPSNMVH